MEPPPKPLMGHVIIINLYERIPMDRGCIVTFQTRSWTWTWTSQCSKQNIHFGCGNLTTLQLVRFGVKTICKMHVRDDDHGCNLSIVGASGDHLEQFHHCVFSGEIFVDVLWLRLWMWPFKYKELRLGVPFNVGRKGIWESAPFVFIIVVIESEFSVLVIAGLGDARPWLTVSSNTENTSLVMTPSFLWLLVVVTLLVIV